MQCNWNASCICVMRALCKKGYVGEHYAGIAESLAFLKLNVGKFSNCDPIPTFVLKQRNVKIFQIEIIEERMLVSELLVKYNYEKLKCCSWNCWQCRVYKFAKHYWVSDSNLKFQTTCIHCGSTLTVGFQSFDWFVHFHRTDWPFSRDYLYQS